MVRIPTHMNNRHIGEYRLDRFDSDFITYLGFEFVKDKKTLVARQSKYQEQGKKIWAFFIDREGKMKRLKHKQLSIH